MAAKGNCIICCKEASCSVHGMLLCDKHRSQWYRHKCFNDNTIYAPNEYIIHEDYAEIVLKNSNCDEVGRALIDVEDVEDCKKYKRHTNKKGYAIATIPNGIKAGGQKIFLHRLVSKYSGNDMVIDHINRNVLDNRKHNLRIVTQQTNASNNGATGVIRVPSGRYQAHVTRHYKNIYIGTFDTYDQALCARKAFVSGYDDNDHTKLKEKKCV